nr:PREDICTED: DPY30 domain-containing protein 1-like [Equus przewalskii]
MVIPGLLMLLSDSGVTVICADSNTAYFFLNVQQQLAFQLELEMQEKERQRTEELQRAQEQLEKEARLDMDSMAKSEDTSHSEDAAADSGKTLAEISDRYGAPNLSRVEELDEPMLSDVALNIDQDL